MYHEMLSIKYHVAPIQNSYKTIKDKLNLLSLAVYQFLLKFHDVKLLIKSYVLYICYCFVVTNCERILNQIK